MFFGVIRPYCGSGWEGGESVTFREFKRARADHKPCWYVIDNRVCFFRQLLRVLHLKRGESNKKINAAIQEWINQTPGGRAKTTEVKDLFEPDRSYRYFDFECFDMEDFVNHMEERRQMKNGEIEEVEIVNNWMHYFDDITGIKKFIDTNFSDKERIVQILKEYK